MTYSHLPLMCDCGSPTMLTSAFDSHGLCTACACVFIAARGTERRSFDVLSVETFLREFAADSRSLFGGRS